MAKQRRTVEGAVVLRLAPEPSDESLVLQARQGDERACAWLIERHAPRVTRVLARILGRDAELVDHVQEVLMRAARDIEALREPTAFQAWITALAVTEARRVLRRRARWRWLWGAESRTDVEAIGTDGSAAQEAVRAVYAAMGRLAVDERVAFTLRHLDGMELTEVATATGLSLATVKRRLARAEERFAKLTEGVHALNPWRAGSRFDRGGDP
jgi:RNA polymerase sigma-70 factor (ECF subfamily)